MKQKSLLFQKLLFFLYGSSGIIFSLGKEKMLKFCVVNNWQIFLRSAALIIISYTIPYHLRTSYVPRRSYSGPTFPPPGVFYSCRLEQTKRFLKENCFIGLSVELSVFERLWSRYNFPSSQARTMRKDILKVSYDLKLSYKLRVLNK